MYGITTSVKLFFYELTYWLINEVGFKQSQYQMSKYYKYAPYGGEKVVLYYVDDLSIGIHLRLLKNGFWKL